MSILEKLTEGMVPRDLHAESHALVEKWERTGLLEGLGSGEIKNQMSRLLENQAKELLREASTMAGGDVEGFAAVAFPLVRRVFGSLVAQDLVSVQPMSLPSGLIFFLDFTYAGGPGFSNSGRLGNLASGSIYGGGRVAAQITGGVILTGDQGQRGPYNLNNGYSSPTGSQQNGVVINDGAGTGTGQFLASGTVGGTQYTTAANTQGFTLDQLCRFDPDLEGHQAIALSLKAADIHPSADGFLLNERDLVSITINDDGSNQLQSAAGGAQVSSLIRRLTQYYTGSVTTEFGQLDADRYILVLSNYASSSALASGLGAITASVTGSNFAATPGSHQTSFAASDDFIAGGQVGSVVGDPQWGLENNAEIPEIDIKVDSVSVTAMTKKLKAKWTPELGQDLNAYHNLDAEVELTSILSEQIALEIDREVLEDLVVGGTADTLYWSRRPGKFVNRATGADITANGTQGPDFTGTVSEWYETLLETINDVSAQIHRKTLRGGANFVVVSPEMANLLEFTAGFRASVTHDDDRGTIGAVKVGSLSKKFDVYVDPYFLRNVVLVGRKGASFLESGYVYAPYVPLQVTPTIFGVEDFVPRKGVMTRYAKKMVRPDMYGLVIVTDFLS
jgi:hypothetical protein